MFDKQKPNQTKPNQTIELVVATVGEFFSVEKGR